MKQLILGFLLGFLLAAGLASAQFFQSTDGQISGYRDPYGTTTYQDRSGNFGYLYPAPTPHVIQPRDPC